MEPDPKQFLAVAYDGYCVRKLSCIGTTIIIHKPAEMAVDAFRKLAIMYLHACDAVDADVLETAGQAKVGELNPEDETHDAKTQH